MLVNHAMEMNDTELLGLIAGGSKVVVDVWGDNCPYCVEFAPIFDSVAKDFPETKFVKFNLPKVGSEFKKKYMTLQAGSNGVPAIYEELLKEKQSHESHIVTLNARLSKIAVLISAIEDLSNAS